MADVSPIAPLGQASVRRKQEEERVAARDGLPRERTEVSPSTPHTGSPTSPSVSESPEAALLRSGDEEFLTPRPNANRLRNPHAGVGRERPPSALHELSVHESRLVYDLDVSMQSMNLSDDGFMIVDNPDDDNDASDPDADSERSRTRLDAEDEDAGALGERNKVLKVLCFSSESEDEEMDCEYGGGSEYDEPDEEMSQANGDYEAECVDSAKQQQVVKAEPGSEDVEVLEVVAPADPERPVARPHVVNASRESCDSVDSNQGAHWTWRAWNAKTYWLLNTDCCLMCRSGSSSTTATHFPDQAAA